MSKKFSNNKVTEFKTAGAGRVFQIPLREFPGLLGYVYLISYEDYLVLIDTGSGFGDSNFDLENGLDAIGNKLGNKLGLADVTHILITHGHVDHFGGLNYIRSRSNALVGIHELDRRIITNYEERLAIVANRLDDYFTEAGVSKGQRENLIQLYKTTKSLYSSENVDFTFETNGMTLGPFKMIHVPGHSAGHVVIRFDDILFSGDHVLDETSPHQAPEQITLSTGLDHYLQSLEKLHLWAKDVRITLGGHEQPVHDLETRIDVIREHHMFRLQMVLDLMNKPSTIANVSQKLFGDIQGYHQLLAIEETGAHVEYLYQRGMLTISNLSEIDGKSNGNRIPIQYQCNECELMGQINI